jgi:uncharacterized coiled-coil protein SlyX
MTAAEVERRRAQVESNVAHLERQVDALNSVVIEQGRELVRLRKTLEHLAATLLGGQAQDAPSNEKPPHYLP